MHVSKVARHPPDLCKAGLCTDLCTARPEAQDHHGRAMLACPEGDTLSPSTLLSQRSMRDGSPNSTMLSHSEAGGFLGKAPPSPALPLSPLAAESQELLPQLLPHWSCCPTAALGKAVLAPGEGTPTRGGILLGPLGPLRDLIKAPPLPPLPPLPPSRHAAEAAEATEAAEAAEPAKALVPPLAAALRSFDLHLGAATAAAAGPTPRAPIKAEPPRLDALTPLRPIGAGGFGRVQLMRHAPTRRVYALKVTN